MMPGTYGIQKYRAVVKIRLFQKFSVEVGVILVHTVKLRNRVPTHEQ